MRRHATLLALLASALLPACGDRPAAVEEASPTARTEPESSLWRWQCEDVAFDAVVHPGHIVLHLAGGELTLPQVAAASGSHYQEGTTSFWSKGRKATFEFKGSKLTCHGRRDPWDEAKSRGIVLRAIGQEPGWQLEIGADTIHLLYDYAEEEVVASVPEPQREGSVTTWDAATSEKRLRAVAEEKRCADAMSGEPFPLTVTVEIDGRSLAGCGRRLDAEEASQR
jgi:putative lipoprotein